MMKGGVMILLGFFVVLQLGFLRAESEAEPPSQAVDEPHSYIVYVSGATADGESPKERCLRILSSVFPSKKAAEDALMYVYSVFHGFAVKLTSHQTTLLKAQAEVMNVVRDIKFQLDLAEGKGGE